MREVVDEATGISSKVVIDWKQQPRGGDLRPRIVLRDDKGERADARQRAARRATSCRSTRSSRSRTAPPVKAGDVLARIPRESSKTRDITGGLPRVAELFEARKPKDFAIISEIDGRVEFGKDYKTKRRIVVVPTEEGGEPVEYLIPKGKHISVQEGDYVQKGDLLMDGNPVPHDILRVLGVEALASYLDQRDPGGLSAAGRAHQRQAHRGDRPPDAAEGRGRGARRHHLPRRRADRPRRVRGRERQGRGRGPAPGDGAHPVLQGITKASLQTNSFISAASFQETTRVLTEAAVSGPDRRADRAQGERHRRPADPGRHRQRHGAVARGRGRARPRACRDRREADEAADERSRQRLRAADKKTARIGRRAARRLPPAVYCPAISAQGS